MRAGKMRWLATLYQPSSTGDAYSTSSSGYDLEGNVRISFEPLKGREMHEAKQTGSELVARVRMRYRADVKASWRIELNGITYEILDPPVDRKNHKTELEMLIKVVA